MFRDNNTLGSNNISVACTLEIVVEITSRSTETELAREGGKFMKIGDKRVFGEKFWRGE